MEINNLRHQNSYYLNELQTYQQNQNNTNYMVSANYEQEIDNLKNVILNERTFTNELKTQLDLKNAEISHLVCFFIHLFLVESIKSSFL
jgi:ribosome-binding ATPase YchF (GTP1/OBG family)